MGCVRSPVQIGYPRQKKFGVRLFLPIVNLFAKQSERTVGYTAIIFRNLKCKRYISGCVNLIRTGSEFYSYMIITKSLDLKIKIVAFIVLTLNSSLFYWYLTKPWERDYYFYGGILFFLLVFLVLVPILNIKIKFDFDHNSIHFYKLFRVLKIDSSKVKEWGIRTIIRRYRGGFREHPPYFECKLSNNKVFIYPLEIPGHMLGNIKIDKRTVLINYLEKILKQKPIKCKQIENEPLFPSILRYDFSSMLII